MVSIKIDATGRRVDLNQRPEVTKGTVEYVAPTDYMVRPPMLPVYFFLIDVSITAVRSVMVESILCQPASTENNNYCVPANQSLLPNAAITDPHAQQKKERRGGIRPLGESTHLDDIFVPLPDYLLVNLSESRSVVETFLDSLPSMFQDKVNLESAFGPALKAAFTIMVC
ncbi:Protein transport protein Sec24-like [Glycine soja]|uniref:Protein transport protein Sec24-like n=1 Tax=Glycine soja TaxID=3848 RepID=A0A0B2QX82_GLYSO|nr:Protein transport protein Sec24-like [Glycine soja]